jgi:hypothetical protein
VAVRLLLLATLALILAPAPALAGGTSSRLEQAYTITATLDVATGRLEATERITVTNGSARTLDHLDLSVLPRAFGYVTVDAPVTIDGIAADTEWTTETNLRLPMAGGLPPDTTIEVELPFVLVVGNSGGAFTARTSRDNGVISFGQWFPILSREHASYGVGDAQVTTTAESIVLDLTTTAPMPRNAVACPGLVEAPRESGTHWRCEVERVRDFSFVVNPRFRLVTRSVDGIDMRIYTETVDGTVVADKATFALTRMGEAFGAYPWPDLVLAEVGSGGGFSMEYPRSIHLTRGKVTDTYVIYHEVAHQWFYAQLGNDQMREPWLDEGFANFSTRWLMGTDENACSTRPVDSQIYAWPAGTTTGGDWLSCDGYFHTVFYRGTEFINAIRAEMGDAAFFAAMRAFIDEHRYGVASIGALRRHLDSSTEADLAPLYATYLGVEPRAARIVART